MITYKIIIIYIYTFENTFDKVDFYINEILQL